MAKHTKIAVEVRRLIRKRRLGPGDPIPSDRQLAKQFRVSHNTVRYANDLLCREGLLHRRHGRGTFLAQSKGAQAKHQLRHRLGLLYVDPQNRASTYSQLLTAGIQRTANKAGYEVVIEEMQSEALVQGMVPEMIRRNSVDAVLLDGAVRKHHIRFLEDQQVLYLVTGTCPLGTNVPQIRLNGERLGFEITRELLQAGRSPVWLDLDLSRTERYHMGLELFRGYSDAVQKYGDGKHSLHLCPLYANQIAGAATKLVQAGLKNAAIIVQDWGSTLLPSALALKSPNANDLLIVPITIGFAVRPLSEGNVVRWSQVFKTEMIGEKAVGELVGVLENRSSQFRTLSLEMSCKLQELSPVAKMDLHWEWKPTEAFALEQQGAHHGWRHLGAVKNLETNPAANRETANVLEAAQADS